MLGAIDNRPTDNEEKIKEEGYELQYDHPEERVQLGDTEMIVAMKLGLDDFSNVTQVQFVIASI